MSPERGDGRSQIKKKVLYNIKPLPTGHYYHRDLTEAIDKTITETSKAIFDDEEKDVLNMPSKTLRIDTDYIKNKKARFLK